MAAVALLIILCLSRFVVAVGGQSYVGPTLDYGLGALSGGAGYYMLDGLVLPTGTINGLDYYVDRSSQWSPFTLTIFRPIGDSATTTQYRIIGTYPVTVEPSVVTGIASQNMSSADYIDVTAGDHTAFYSNLQHMSITAQFDANSNFNTRFSVPSNPVPAVGDSITFDRVGLGPTFYSLRVLVDESTNTVTTCQGGGFSVCDQLCTDDVTGYYCSCSSFYQLDPTDNATCVPIQRTCANTGNNYCSHNCTDTSTSFVCSCRQGFTLQSNGYSCVEDDLSGFIGEQGQTGLKGERGLQGSRGQKGVVGDNGPYWSTGSNRSARCERSTRGNRPSGFKGKCRHQRNERRVRKSRSERGEGVRWARRSHRSSWNYWDDRVYRATWDKWTEWCHGSEGTKGRYRCDGSIRN
ncbi:uncharacterized protein LOC117334298 isoform X1 [Pecten maximus]|uniref:uncharacterized protein LOC117334298 isoform X1 n=1 Tax=Pecten maximus TaxID=6579 RepID=UPI0014582BEB|nr:uncharacterized protein LOC117334298 isoform X1 [Pecten maximus]